MTNNISKTRKGDREIISVSIPVSVYEQMQRLCDHYDLNRSSMITRAIVDYMLKFGFESRGFPCVK